VPTRVIVIRHGESQHTVDRVVGGPRGDRGLTEKGRAQAQDLALRLSVRDLGPVVLYSSTLARAIETAAPIAEALGVAAGTDCGLCSWHVPDAGDGLAVEVYRERLSIEGGGIFRPFEQGNESWAEMVTRTSRTMIDLAHRHRGQTLILVGHAETVNISFHAFGLLSLYTPFDTVIANTSVTEWTTDDDPAAHPPARWTLHHFNL
jgi:probable phosphoglycerate mutase